jgi:hypothetical protein
MELAQVKNALAALPLDRLPARYFKGYFKSSRLAESDARRKCPHAGMGSRAFRRGRRDRVTSRPRLDRLVGDGRDDLADPPRPARPRTTWHRPSGEDDEARATPPVITPPSCMTPYGVGADRQRYLTTANHHRNNAVVHLGAALNAAARP